MNSKLESANLVKNISPDSNSSISKFATEKSAGEKSFSLKTKATLLAIAIGVIPVASVGLLAYNILNRSLTKQIKTEQLEKTEIAADSITKFLEDRVLEIDAISKSAIFTDSKLRDALTLQEKAAVLDHFKDELKYYNSLVYFAPQGDPVFQAKSDKPNTKNYGSKEYFQEAIKTDRVTINGPGISPSSGQLRVEFAAPVKDRATGEIIGVLRFKIPGNYINGLFNVYEQQSKNWSLLNNQGKIFAGDRPRQLNQAVAEHFTAIEALHSAKENGVVISNVSNFEEISEAAEENDAATQTNVIQEQLVSYVAAPAPSKFPNLYIGVLMAQDKAIAFAPIRQLGWTLFFGTAVAAILVSAIAAYLANRATIPLIDAVRAVKNIGKGKLDTRLAVNRQDELGELNGNINLMTEQIQNLIQEQETVAQQQRQEKEALEQAIFTLMYEVGNATEGDLTVRANLDSIELSTVADLFNAIIGNLQDIAIEAKQSTGKVGSSLKQNETEIRLLAEQAIQEAQEIRNTLMSVEQMSQSIEVVAQNASQAATIMNSAYDTIADSTTNMDSTVDSILQLRTTVNETTRKMKNLQESSQKINQAIALIEEIALKTNVLAINAGTEAERAGEYGQGFAVVAQQVGVLAEQSNAAIREIARTVAEIQAETQEVNQAMLSGTTQVAKTTQLVKSTKGTLEQALEKSQQINQLIGSISRSTISQTTTSQNVIGLMQKIAQLSEKTSKSSERVAKSIVETANIAERLESAVAQFKVAQ